MKPDEQQLVPVKKTNLKKIYYKKGVTFKIIKNKKKIKETHQIYPFRFS